MDLNSVLLDQQLHLSPLVLIKALSFANPFAIRTIRSVISEYYLYEYLLQQKYNFLPVHQNDPFDFAVQKNNNQIIKIQLKLQRQQRGTPIDKVEVQRARNGFDKNGNKTRPYQFCDFDVLAVCLEPSTKNWTDFVFIKSENLKADKNNPNNINKMQKIDLNNKNWFFDL